MYLRQQIEDIAKTKWEQELGYYQCISLECQVSLSYTRSQYTPICAEYSSMLAQAREANQSLIASNSSSMGPYRQCRADQSRKVTIILLVESEGRQWKENLPSYGCAP